MLVYMDESGTPGVAKAPNDWLVVAMVAFENVEEVKTLSDKIKKLREQLNLPEDYEFHRVKDPLAVRSKFEKTIFSADFKIYVVAFRKNNFKNHASFRHVAERIVFAFRHFEKVRITSDTNPLLVSEINKEAKRSAVKNVRAKDTDSRKSDMVQVADYIVNISGRIYKNEKSKPPKGYSERLHFASATK